MGLIQSLKAPDLGPLGLRVFLWCFPLQTPLSILFSNAWICPLVYGKDNSLSLLLTNSNIVIANSMTRQCTLIQISLNNWWRNMPKFFLHIQTIIKICPPCILQPLVKRKHLCTSFVNFGQLAVQARFPKEQTSRWRLESRTFIRG